MSMTIAEHAVMSPDCSHAERGSSSEVDENNDADSAGPNDEQVDYSCSARGRVDDEGGAYEDNCVVGCSGIVMTMEDVTPAAAAVSNARMH